MTAADPVLEAYSYISHVCLKNGKQDDESVDNINPINRSSWLMIEAKGCALDPKDSFYSVEGKMGYTLEHQLNYIVKL